MTSFRVFAVLFCAAATMSSACLMEPVDDEMPEDIDVASSDITIQMQYHLDRYYHSYESFIYGEGVSDSAVLECDQFDDGVVRNWHLKERNHYDYRYSRAWCRNMGPDGTLEPGSDSRTHFFYDGDGTLGTTPIPLDTLPVGVRIRAKYDPFGFSGYVYKIGDVALLYDSASDILNGYTGYQATSYAFGHSGGSTYTIDCPPGKVMTGIGIFKDIVSGGNNQAEIRGLKIRCDKLVRIPVTL